MFSDLEDAINKLPWHVGMPKNSDQFSVMMELNEWLTLMGMLLDERQRQSEGDRERERMKEASL